MTNLKAYSMIALASCYAVSCDRTTPPAIAGGSAATQPASAPSLSVAPPMDDGSPKSAVAALWRSYLANDTAGAQRSVTSDAASQSTARKMVAMHREAAALQESVSRVLGAKAAKTVYAWSINKRYFDSVSTGLKYATTKIESADAKNAPAKTTAAKSAAARARVSVERPESNYVFTVEQVDAAWRVDISRDWNRYSTLLTDAMVSVNGKVNKEFYQDADAVTAAVDALMFRNGLPGRYGVELLDAGKWMTSSALIRLDCVGNTWQAEVGDTKSPGGWRQANLAIDGGQFLIQDTWIGTNWLVNIGDYDLMQGTLNAAAGATTIRLIYQGPP